MDAQGLRASRVSEGQPKVWRIADKEAGDRDADKGYIPILQPGLLEPCAMKGARTVLRGGGRGDTSSLPDEHKLWRSDPTGYHVVNVLLHLANTLLLWHLMQRMAVSGAWVVATVFGVHPLHVESVAWVIERKDVLSGLFYLAAALLWMRFIEKPQARYYVGSMALYAAALLSKSIAVTLPAALLIYHWWKRGRVISADLLTLVPFGVIGLIITVGDLSFYQSMGRISFDYSLTERTLIAARVLWFYAGKLLWPSELVVVYPRWDIRVADPLAWGYLIAAIALAVALWHLRHQIGRGPLAGALFFAVTLSPVLGFVDHSYMQFAFVADRFQYLAGIGVMAVVIGAVTCGVEHLSDLSQKGARVVAAVVIVVLGLQTWQQASIWQDNETFWRHVIAHNPQATNAHLNLGVALSKQERYDEALEMARIAVQQDPNSYKAHNNVGIALIGLERFKQAEAHLRRVVELNPKYTQGHFNLGENLFKQKRYEEAIVSLHVTLKQDPNHIIARTLLVGALNGLALQQMKQERYADALESFQEIVALDPDDAKAQGNIGLMLFVLGSYDEALKSLDLALEIDPTLEYLRAHRKTVIDTRRRNVKTLK